ncbi:hypothetical protein CCUS01_15791 [Colletotrichum cuscutae]|uniref:Uncharacterized protein n=1 Tax=Colletotrichum cuscutae TaxID=1209917 RepID=A0AAI9VF92_9PEZI|nr:hypothetical protein CCUS01_15791 [Colletotrichum cuscutae]
MEHALNAEEFLADVTGGNMAVVRWKHTPDASDFDDAAAFEIIRRAVISEMNDPQRLRKVAVEIAALIPALRPSDDVLKSVCSVAKDDGYGDGGEFQREYDRMLLALIALQDGFEQLNRLHGLNQVIRDCMTSPYQSTNRMETLTRWVNLNAFASLLWSYNLIDGRDYAIQQLRTAFEDRRSSDASDRDGADARLVAAAQWAVHSCQRLYHLSVTSEATSPAKDPQQTTMSEGTGESNGKKARKSSSSSSSSAERWRCGPRFKGRAGFSFRRWEFWQQAFEEAKEFGDCGSETKVEAGAAAGMMEKVLYAGFEV